MLHIQQYLSKRIIQALFVTLTILTPSLLFGQKNYTGDIKLAIGPIINNTDLSYIDSLSDTAEENILFTGNMINRFKIIDKSGEKFTTITDYKQLKRISKTTKCNYLITGIIYRTDSGYTLTLALYNAYTEEIQTTKDAQFSRATDIFDISDQLTLALFEELTGSPIKKESITFINESPGTSFMITANGKKIDESKSTISFVEGKYTIKVYNTSVSPKRKVLTTKIVIKEGYPQKISFDLSGKNARKSNQPNRFNRKNTIRVGTGAGVLIFDDSQTTSSSIPLLGLMADLPGLYYSHLITDSVGVTIGGSIFPSLSLNSLGFKVKAGPHFRLGRWGINPMLGYGFVLSSLDENSLEDFLNNAEVSAEQSDDLLSWGEIILMVDFFFIPGFSIYGELACTIGYTEQHHGGDAGEGIDAGTYTGLGVGFSCVLGVGFSF